MKERTRRKRAVLRDRRKDSRDERRYGPPLIRALNAWDLYLAQQYGMIRSLGQRLAEGAR